MEFLLTFFLNPLVPAVGQVPFVAGVKRVAALVGALLVDLVRSGVAPALSIHSELHA